MTTLGKVVFPGDTFTAKGVIGRKGKVRIGLGLTPSKVKNKDKKDNEYLQESILVTRTGVIKSISSSSADTPKIWVTNEQKRYIPYTEDRVIGIIIRRTAFYYHVDIGGPRIGLLGILEFEGATKRNRPELNIGDIIFCRVLISNRDMQPILTCKSPTFNKSWVSGEALFMQLKNGFMFQSSLNWCHKLNCINSPHLQFLATFFPFEIAIGVNGRIWCKTSNTKHTLLLSNIIKNGQYLNMKQFQIMTHSLLKKYGIHGIQQIVKTEN